MSWDNIVQFRPRRGVATFGDLPPGGDAEKAVAEFDTVLMALGYRDLAGFRPEEEIAFHVIEQVLDEVAERICERLKADIIKNRPDLDVLT